LTHASLKFVLALFAFQRGKDMVADEFEQREIVAGIDGAVAVALHNESTLYLAVVQHRHAQPVVAVRAGENHGPVHLLKQLFVAAHQRLALCQQVPRERMPAIFQLHVAGGVWLILVLGIGVIEKTQCVAFGVIADDEKVFGIHQSADDAMDLMQHVWHVEIRPGQIGDHEERALQVFRMFQLAVRIVEVGQLHGMVQLAYPELQVGFQVRQEVFRRPIGSQSEQQHYVLLAQQGQCVVFAVGR
jgi:hypothetical protein